jgi:uncharacterized protein (TIGR02001 family)
MGINMKTYYLAAATGLALTLIAGGAQAQITTTGSFGYYSDYRLRGVSQSDNHAVVQGNLEFDDALSKDFTIYLGAWASSLDKNAFAPTLNGDGPFGSLETDLYVGFKGTYGKLGYSGKYLRLVYNDGIGDFDQFAFEADYPIGPVAAALGVVEDSYSPGNSTYVYANGSYPIGKTPFSLHAGVGYEDGTSVNNKVNWNVGASYAFQKFTLSADYVDTNKTVSDFQKANLAGAEGLVTLSASF